MAWQRCCRCVARMGSQVWSGGETPSATLSRFAGEGEVADYRMNRLRSPFCASGATFSFT